MRQSITKGQSEFSLAIASRALAASTVAYLEPKSRGMTFTAYDSIEKDTLLPPFSHLVSAKNCGKDISVNAKEEKKALDDSEEGGRDDDSFINGASIGVETVGTGKDRTKTSAASTEATTVDSSSSKAAPFCGVATCLDNVICDEACTSEGDPTSNATLDSAMNLQAKYNGDYEIEEFSDDKRSVRCLIAVVHGKVVVKKKVNIIQGEKDTDSLEYTPGSISITFRGTDTLDNVIKDTKAIALKYDNPPFVPEGGQGVEGDKSRKELEKDIKGAYVHHGINETWSNWNMRETTLQHLYNKIIELNRETQEAQRGGLLMPPFAALPTIDITGHSLGGSLAVLMAFDLSNSLSYTGMSGLAYIRVYTFGCPRHGNVSFRKVHVCIVLSYEFMCLM